jgi:hypothetical protein
MSLELTATKLRSRSEQEVAQSRRPVMTPAGPAPDESISDLPSSHGFSALLSAYRSTGGTARGDDLARLLEDYRLGDFVSLAKLIASNAVFGFPWRATLWIPMFQFDLRDLSMKEGPRQVLQELGCDFDGWARAVWFVMRHARLGGRRPVDLLKADLSDVLDVARADRFSAGHVR